MKLKYTLTALVVSVLAGPALAGGWGDNSDGWGDDNGWYTSQASGAVDAGGYATGWTNPDNRDTYAGADDVASSDVDVVLGAGVWASGSKDSVAWAGAQDRHAAQAGTTQRSDLTVAVRDQRGRYSAASLAAMAEGGGNTAAHGSDTGTWVDVEGKTDTDASVAATRNGTHSDRSGHAHHSVDAVASARDATSASASATVESRAVVAEGGTGPNGGQKDRPNRGNNRGNNGDHKK